MRQEFLKPPEHSKQGRHLYDKQQKQQPETAEYGVYHTFLSFFQEPEAHMFIICLHTHTPSLFRF